MPLCNDGTTSACAWGAGDPEDPPQTPWDDGSELGCSGACCACKSFLASSLCAAFVLKTGASLTLMRCSLCWGAGEDIAAGDEGKGRLNFPSHQTHRRFCLTGNLHTSSPPFAPNLQFPSLQLQNTSTSNSKLPGWRRLAIKPRKIQIPGATRPTGTRPVNHETTAPAPSALAAPPIRRWLGNKHNVCRSVIGQSASPEAPSPLFLVPRCRTVSKHSHQHHWDDGMWSFSGTSLGFGNRTAAARQRWWCNPEGGRLATTTAMATAKWANGKHIQPRARNSCRGEKGFR